MGVTRTALLSTLFTIIAQPAFAQQPPPQSVQSTVGELRIEKLATLEYPWGMAYLPDGKLLITEKPGRLRVLSDGKLSEPIEGLPKVTYRGPRDQGGLMDVEIDPKFQENNYIYLSYVEAADPQPKDNLATDDFRLGGVDLSDNVLRGGLTPKHVDVPELLRVLDFDASPPALVPTAHEGRELRYLTPAPEFALSRLDLDGNALSLATRGGPEIVLLTRGHAELRHDDTRVTLAPGSSAFVADSARTYSVSGSGTLFRAGINPNG